MDVRALDLADLQQLPQPKSRVGAQRRYEQCCKLVHVLQLADLELLAGADAFVGTAASWTSRMALLAIVGERGELPPFELLDGPLGSVWTMAPADIVQNPSNSKEDRPHDAALHQSRVSPSDGGLATRTPTLDSTVAQGRTAWERLIPPGMRVAFVLQ